MMLKMVFITFSLVFFSTGQAVAKSKKHKTKLNKKAQQKTTAVSICKRNQVIENKSLVENNKAIQAVIVAMETANEKNCKLSGQRKADQYNSAGWSCRGPNSKNSFSCVSDKAQSFARYKGVSLDYLSFTNLHGHHSLIAYMNPDSLLNCLDDKSDVEASAVSDAQCFKSSKH